MEESYQTVLRGGGLSLQTVLGLVELFLWNSKLKIARCMEYRFDFITGSIVSLCLAGIGPFVQYLIFSQTRGYPGWTIRQLILFQGMMLLWFGIRDTAFGDLKQYAMDMVRQGDFDRLLLKPYPPIGILLISGFNFKNIGSILIGALIILFSAQALALRPGLFQILLIVVCFLSGLLFNMALDIFFCGIVIMLTQMGRIGDLIETLLGFSRYPVEIFSKVMRLIFLTVVPFAIWIYFPTQLLLNRLQGKILLGLLICGIWFWLSLIFWDRCLKKYTSAGG